MKKYSTTILILALFMLNNKTNAQNSTLKNDLNLFNFWIGEWEVSWAESKDKKGYGTNTITKTLDGKVINEDFQIFEGQSKGFKGNSISTFLTHKKVWKQTWVDSNGGYYEFTGGIENGHPIFKTKVVEFKGKKYVQRMTFKDIKKDSFVWDWESSTDGGKTWALQWKINYKRKTSNNNLPNPKAPKETIQYGQLVGTWNCLISTHKNDSIVSQSNAKWTFKYILDGFAVQDFWENPAVVKTPKGKKTLGTNIRIYNPKLKLWQCAWMENSPNSLAGNWLSKMNKDGSLSLYDKTKNWEILFYNITDKSFDWKWDFKQKDGTMKTMVSIKATK